MASRHTSGRAARRRSATPERTCVGCRTRRPKGDLIRVVRDRSGTAVTDRAGTAPGRGAYVCRDRVCAREATRRGALARALRAGSSELDLFTLTREIEREIE